MSVSNDQRSGSQTRTRAAILASTASVLSTNRSATLPDIAAAAGVGRTTVHRYFADREGLIREATLDAIRVLDEAVRNAGTDQSPALEAMQRLINALVSVGDRILFLFGDVAGRRSATPADRPDTQSMVAALIKRGQAEGAFDADLTVASIEHALYALVRAGCEDANYGVVPRHIVASTIIRILESGIRTPS